MALTRPRPSAYIWVSWIAPLLAGTSSCAWSAWFKAHHFYRKLTSFDEASWTAEHAPMVKEARESLIADGFDVTVEDQNKFTLTNGGITLAGKPDLIGVQDDRVLVLDCKSGAPQPSHVAQVMIYMAVLPCVRPELKGRLIEGLLLYHDDEVSIPAEATDPAFREHLRSLIHLVGGPEAPARIPSARECHFCPIGPQDCTDRVELVEAVAVTEHDLF